MVERKVQINGGEFVITSPIKVADKLEDLLSEAQKDLNAVPTSLCIAQVFDKRDNWEGTESSTTVQSVLVLSGFTRDVRQNYVLVRYGKGYGLFSYSYMA